MSLSLLKFLALGVLVFLVGCTSVNVRPFKADSGIRHVCIKENPKVTVPGFLTVIEDGFEDHGLTTEIFHGYKAPEHCQAVLTYTALRSWDFATYLSHAELRLRDPKGKTLGHAEYHLNGKGGLSLMKWAGVKSKMEPVIDELLSDFPVAGN